MHVKTMEGLAGAGANMKMMNTPFRVFKDAERKGDTAGMERAMGYVVDFAGKAEEYQKEAEKGMKEEAKEAREKAEEEQKKAIEKRKDEREQLEKRIAENRNKNSDTVSVSEGGRAVRSENSGSDDTDADGSVSAEETKEAVTGNSVFYNRTGEAVKTESGANISVTV